MKRTSIWTDTNSIPMEGSILAYTNALSAGKSAVLRTSAGSVYRETRIKTASQGQLIVMLYDKAVQHLDRGLKLLETNSGSKKDPGKIEDINKSILKAQEIVTELMVSLDFEQGGEIAKNLFSLYSWFNQELLEANIKQDTRRVVVVRNMISDLRSAWAEIAAKNAAEVPQKEPVGLNIAG